MKTTVKMINAMEGINENLKFILLNNKDLLNKAYCICYNSDKNYIYITWKNKYGGEIEEKIYLDYKDEIVIDMWGKSTVYNYIGIAEGMEFDDLEDALDTSVELYKNRISIDKWICKH